MKILPVILTFLKLDYIYYMKVTEIYEQPYDVLTMVDVEALKRDTAGSRTASIEAEIELGYFVVQMHGLQRYYQQMLLRFIGNLLGVSAQPVINDTDVEVEDVEPTQIEEPQIAQQSKDKRIVKGVVGLSKCLGCGTTKTQEILNSGILQKNGMGKGWRINTEKLKKDSDL